MLELPLNSTGCSIYSGVEIHRRQEADLGSLGQVTIDLAPKVSQLLTLHSKPLSHFKQARQTNSSATMALFVCLACLKWSCSPPPLPATAAEDKYIEAVSMDCWQLSNGSFSLSREAS